jgi:choline dehydrogenase-like flavoprotein
MNKKTVVVVGGGTAGLTIAHNLQDFFNVIVVEKSEYKKYPLIFRVPLLIGLLYRRKKLKYISKKELVLANGRHIPFFESNVLGGASVINGCVHTIGSRLIWEDILGDFNSDYNELISSYNGLYTTSQEEGKINLTLAPQNSIDKAFVKALNNNRVPIGDMNFSNEENCGPIYDTTKGLFRSSVLSLIKKKGFKILMGESVNRVLVENDAKVVGVETNKRVLKSDYVILSSGVIGTCSLLLREKENKGTVNNIRYLDIGCEVKDHTNLRINVITKAEIGSLNEVSRSFRKKLSMLIKHFSGKPTLMVGTGATSGVHLDLNGDGRVDARIHVVQFTETGRHGSSGEYFSEEPGFSLSITPINPASKGNIRLAGGRATVDPMFLSDKKDIEILKLSLSYCLKLLRSEPINDFVQEIVNEHLIESDPERYINENIFSGGHLIGGAHNAVGDDFKVKGMSGLYICDASIFKEYAASNIHSSVILISDIFSRRFILKNIN